MGYGNAIYLYGWREAEPERPREWSTQASRHSLFSTVDLLPPAACAPCPPAHVRCRIFGAGRAGAAAPAAAGPGLSARPPAWPGRCPRGAGPPVGPCPPGPRRRLRCARAGRGFVAVLGPAPGCPPARCACPPCGPPLCPPASASPSQNPAAPGRPPGRGGPTRVVRPLPAQLGLLATRPGSPGVQAHGAAGVPGPAVVAGLLPEEVLLGLLLPEALVHRGLGRPALVGVVVGLSWGSTTSGRSRWVFLCRAAGGERRGSPASGPVHLRVPPDWPEDSASSSRLSAALHPSGGLLVLLLPFLQGNRAPGYGTAGLAVGLQGPLRPTGVWAQVDISAQ